MQLPISWLKSFCNPSLDAQQLADVLTMGGLEVEDSKTVAPAFSQVVVGQILEAAPHPDADRLRVCQVDVGRASADAKPLSIVCGAPNARAGIKVPVALVGAQLPAGADGQPFLIKLSRLRGVASEGMLCSARELHLSEDHGGLLELDASAPVGVDLRQALDLDDTLLTLKLTPNLAHALSVYGVARELSALTGAPLLKPTFPSVTATIADRLPVRVSAPDLCGRFSGRVIRGVNPLATTPSWMVDRLARCGQRSVSALVDISNYVMFELGRPSHVFDLDKIHGGLEVRWAREGESLRLLNGQTVSLDATVGVIADEQQVESLAGIMGGESTAVGDETRNIYLEAAFWWPKAVAGRSRRFNFSTDAGHRFERGVDPATTLEHIEHITRLILDICGGEAGPIDDHPVNLPLSPVVNLRVARASKVLGMPLTVTQCKNALQRLGLQVHEVASVDGRAIGGDVLEVQAPSHRFDIQIEEDLIEEVARMVGFEHLPQTPPHGPISPQVRAESNRGPFAVRRQLAQLGYQETINFSFVEERWEADLAGNTQPVRLLNPIASPLSVMRSSLLGSLLAVVRANLARKASRVRVFELGRVFLRDASVADTDTTVAGLHQPMRVAGMVYGPAHALQWGQSDGPADFYDIKGDVEALLVPRTAVFQAAAHPAMHPGRCAQVLVDGQVIGHVGELHPRWRQTYELPRAPLMFELSLDAVLHRPLPQAQTLDRFQAVERDLALIVPESVSHDQLLAAIQAAPTQGLLRSAVLFDVYRLESGEKSLAVRLTLNSGQATLTDREIEEAVSAVVGHVASAIGARLRA
jgi:phenylalanyl-tRNA synthetase beta chain